jgi:hypothetical protein
VLATIERVAKRKFVKQQQANFITTWSSSTIRKARNRFHHNFKANMQTDPLLEFLFFQTNQVD